MTDAIDGSNELTTLMHLKNVTVNYGNVKAVDHASLAIRSHTITGVVGDNGAGKSTLVKVLSGVVAPTSGRILLSGEVRRWKSALEARRAGIETVYQDLALLRGLSLWRNFFVGREITRRLLGVPVLDIPSMRRTALTELRRVGLTRLRNADEPVDLLSGGERQTVAVARSVYFGSKILVLDEPMSALAPKERGRVTANMRHARDAGIGVVVVDHNVAHIHEVCDRIIAVSMGQIVLDCAQDEISLAELLRIISE